MTDRQSEPPTPLRSNADFRSFLTATPRIHSATTKPAPAAVAATGQPQKSSKRQEHSQRYFAKQAARQQESKDGSTPTAAAQSGNRAPHGRQQYRDRARERRTEAGQDEEAERLTAAVDEESSKFLGGDVEHTHLVKGLDVALLQRTRDEDEKREQDRLDELARQLSERKEDTSVDATKPPVFRTPLAQSVWEWLHPPPVVPSGFFTPGRLTYAFPLPPRPSRFAQLPLALATAVDSREDVAALYPTLSSLNELPVSVLTSRDELEDDRDDAVGGAVPPHVLRMVKAALERKAARRAKKAQQSTEASPSTAHDGSDDERSNETRADKVAETRESVEERRKRLMEQDDDDIFADIDQPATAAQPPPPTDLTATKSSTLALDAVFPSAAPNSKYFTTAPPSLDADTQHIATSSLAPATPSLAVPLPLSTAVRAEQPSAPRLSAPASSRQMAMDDGEEEEEDDMYASMSFSASFAGDDDSDDEEVKRQDKAEAREQRMQAKRGRGGKNGRVRDKDDGRAKVERKREAKLDRQLAGVTELLEKDNGKLRLESFEKQSAQQSKRFRYG